MRPSSIALAISILSAPLLASPEHAAAGPLTTVSYAETNCGFTWVFKWEFPAAELGSSLVAGLGKWDLRADAFDAPDTGAVYDLKVTAQHRALDATKDRCHATDAPFGDVYTQTRLGIAFIAHSAADVRLDLHEEKHAELTTTHFDVYSLFYRRPHVGPGDFIGDDVIFTLIGAHGETGIAAPSALAALVPALLALLTRRRRGTVGHGRSVHR